MAGEYEKHASMAEQSLSDSLDPALVVATHGHAVLAGLVGEPITARLVEYPKLLAMALEQAVGRFALRDIHSGIAQGRFHLYMSERLLDSILIWSLVGLLIESVEQGTDTDELASAYAVMVLTNLGIPSDEAGRLSEQAAQDIAAR